MIKIYQGVCTCCCYIFYFNILCWSNCCFDTFALNWRVHVSAEICIDQSSHKQVLLKSCWVTGDFKVTCELNLNPSLKLLVVALSLANNHNCLWPLLMTFEKFSLRVRGWGSKLCRCDWNTPRNAAIFFIWVPIELGPTALFLGEQPWLTRLKQQQQRQQQQRR